MVFPQDFGLMAALTFLVFLALGFALIFWNLNFRKLATFASILALIASASSILRFVLPHKINPMVSGGVYFWPVASSAICLFVLSLLLLFLIRSVIHNAGGLFLMWLGAIAILAFTTVVMVGYTTRIEIAYAWGSRTQMAFSTATVIWLFAFISARRIYLAYEEIFSRHPHFFALSVTWIAAGLIILAAASIRDQEQHQLHKQLSVVVKNFADEVSVNLSMVAEELQGNARRWEDRKKLTPQALNQEINRFVFHHPTIAYAVLVDKNYVVQSTTAQERRAAILHLNSGASQRRLWAMQRAREVSGPVMSQPVDLAGGGRGFGICVPFSTAWAPQGFLVATIRFADLFSKIVRAQRLGDYQMQAEIQGEPLFADSIETSSMPRQSMIASAHTTVLEQPWTFTIAPSSQLLATSLTPLPWVIFGMGLLLCLCAYFLMVSYQRKVFALKSLQDSYTKIDSLMRVVPVGVFLTDVQGRVVYVNPRLVDLTGLSPEDEIATQAQKHVHPDDRERMFGSWRRAVERRTGFHDECRYIHPVRGEVWLLSDAIEMRGNKGESIGYVGSVQDITALKRYQASIEQSNRDLEQFAYIASHDLQEPLKTIRSFTDLIRSDGPKAPATHEWMNYVVDATHRMQRLIEALLNSARMQSSARPFVPVSLDNALDSALANLKTSIEQTLAVVRRPPSLPVVHGDEPQLAQLFQNLVSNAIKFVKDRRPEITIEYYEEDDRFVFSVADNGIGIKDEHIEKIFEMFTRLHPENKFSGSGLGLGVCKMIITRHQGHIWAESAPGAGSTFRFKLPKAPPIAA